MLLLFFHLLIYVSSSFRYDLRLLPDLQSPSSQFLSANLNISGTAFTMTFDFSMPAILIFSQKCINFKGNSTFEDIKTKKMQKSLKLKPLKSLQLHNLEFKGQDYSLTLFHTYNQSTSKEFEIKVFVVEEVLNCSQYFYIDGFVGLGLPQDDVEYKTIAETFAEKTESASFALILKNSYENKLYSFIEFGKISAKEGLLGKKRSKRVLEERKTWVLIVNYVEVNELELEARNEAIFDANSDNVKVPKKIFDEFKDMIKNAFGVNDQLKIECKALQVFYNVSLKFKIQRTIFPFRIMNFVEEKEGACRFLFEKNVNDEWVFGKPFFRDFFSIFDYDKREIIFYQIEPFPPGFYEYFIMIFVLVFSISGLLCGWLQTSLPSHTLKNSEESKFKENNLQERLISKD